MLSLTVNGSEHRLDVDPLTPLLWVLRDHLRLTGSKYGCGMALCGACTVHADGVPIRACVVPAGELVGRRITTIEGVDRTAAGRAVQRAWEQLDVAQCGFCQPGQIMSASALLAANPTPHDRDIDAAMNDNVCRCATYQRIRAAVKLAGSALAEGRTHD